MEFVRDNMQELYEYLEGRQEVTERHLNRFTLLYFKDKKQMVTQTDEKSTIHFVYFCMRNAGVPEDVAQEGLREKLDYDIQKDS